MARKPNYDFEKRRKELDRKAKKEAKQQRKRDNAARGTDDAGVDDAADQAVDGVAAPLPAEGPTIE